MVSVPEKRTTNFMVGFALMNERIKELVLEAQIQAARETTQNSFEYEAKVFEKFAELIVEEMYDFIMEESASDNGIPDLGKVKQHFGVEE